MDWTFATGRKNRDGATGDRIAAGQGHIRPPFPEYYGDPYDGRRRRVWEHVALEWSIQDGCCSTGSPTPFGRPATA